MRKLLKGLGYGLGALLVLAVVGAGWIWFASSREINRAYAATPERLTSVPPALMADAARQGRVLGCVNCHGEGLRGRKMLDIPNVVTMWAPNLTLIAARATDQQLAQAIRQGIGLDGKGLWVMPSPQLSRATDQEVSSMIAWIRSLPRGGEETPEPWFGPFGRIGIARGSFKAASAQIEDYRVRQPWNSGPTHEKWRHFAAVACAECHGPDLSGGAAGLQKAPGLSIVGGYDLAQFTRLLRTGQAPSGRDLGVMASVAKEDFVHLRDDEIAALFSYLQDRASKVTDPAVE